MNRAERETLNLFRDQVLSIRVHRKQGLGVALKKPLLLLLILSHFENGKIRENQIRFTDVEEALASLIREFGGRPTTSGPRPEQPYDHMRGSPFWQLHVPGGVPKSRRRTLPVTVLRHAASYAKIENRIFQVLLKSGKARREVFDTILNNWWPQSVHGDIRQSLDFTGPDYLREEEILTGFSDRVRANYRHRCAVCGFDALLNKMPFGLDAAHIQWRTQGGPDLIENALALCKIHHWAMDRGVITFSRELKIQVVEVFVARDRVSRTAFEDFRNRKMQKYRDRAPLEKYLSWHRENVFLGA